MSKQLEDRLGEALHDLADHGTYAPDLTSIERRARRSTRRDIAVRSGAGVGVLAVAAAAFGVVAAGGGSPARTVHPAAPGSPLIRLAASLTTDTTLPGDATEVVRTTSHPGSSPSAGIDLFADDGRYFYSDTAAGLGAAVQGGQEVADGVFARDVAAAQYAADGGDLVTAEQRLAAAALDPGTAYRFEASPPPIAVPPGLTGVQKKAYLVAHAKTGGPAIVDDNSVWTNALDALSAGAGRPEVRAGVLRILSTLPGISVTDTTTDGQPTLTISATGAPDTTAGYRETVVIGASDAIPVSFTGGDVDAAPSVTISYQVKRVTLADLG